MKQSHAFKLLLAFGTCSLIVQFIIIKIFWSAKVLVEDRTPTSKRALTIFRSLCRKQHIPVFLVEPLMLQKMFINSKRQGFNMTDLVNKNKLTTFAVFDTYLKDPIPLLRDFRDNGFSISQSTADVPQFSSLGVQFNREITSHYFLSYVDHVIHLVVFFKLQVDFLWHSAVKHIEPPILLSDRKKLFFVNHAGAYNMFEIKDVIFEGELYAIPENPSKFLQQVVHSRFIECNHERAQQFYRMYPQDKSAESQRFLRKARQVIARAKQLLDDLEIPFWLSSGTCLGWFRQCDIITHSKDVDFGIQITDYKEKLIPTFETGGFFLKHLFGKISDSFELSFQAGDIKLDLFFFYEENGYQWNGGTEVSSGKKYKYIFPRFLLCWTIFLDLKVRVPCDTEKYILANYGPNWFIPVKEWDWMASPSNVRDNGVWPKEEWKTVIQVY
ncbi:hypothetical protein ACJMK2_041908 [Sinanodonta woodiana]|uniref:Ribitol-5-phosphate transferase FKTN N-terminal domain-containing protein n=1 Tax=Sinanodonta woodiana TaxID=1069815 RepID=A0ABD3W8N3_SINWO